MREAILYCPGPTLVRDTCRGQTYSRTPLCVGINTAGSDYFVDYWAAGDFHTLNTTTPKRTPDVGIFGRISPWLQGKVAMPQWAVGLEMHDIQHIQSECPDTNHTTMPATIEWLARMGITLLHVHGCTWEGATDCNGETHKNRNPQRWDMERAAVQSVQERWGSKLEIIGLPCKR